MLEASVIGLGTMGSTLARLLLHKGYHVTVWNRTIAKADPLVRDGAVLAPSAAAAVNASPIVVVCVHDYPATNKILDTKEVAAAITGRILIQLSTGSPQEARDSESWARASEMPTTSTALSRQHQVRWGDQILRFSYRVQKPHSGRVSHCSRFWAET